MSMSMYPVAVLPRCRRLGLLLHMYPCTCTCPCPCTLWQFSLAVEDLGFSSSFAHDLFVELDDDNSGAVSYSHTQLIPHFPTHPITHPPIHPSTYPPILPPTPNYLPTQVRYTELLTQLKS